MGPPPRASRRGAADERRLGLFHAFGSQSDAGALLLDDRTVLHRCGRWLVAQEIDQVAIPTELSPMSFFFEMASDMERLTAMCLSENRRHLALCEVCDASSSSPQVRIVHVPTRRTVCVLSAAIEGEFVGCCFHNDGKHVLAYTGAPEHVTAVWHWVEERPLGMYRSW